MKLPDNDPRLTAYALGELDDVERAKVEALLKDDEAACREVETIRHAGQILSSELAAEPVPELTGAKQQAIEAALKPAADHIGSSAPCAAAERRFSVSPLFSLMRQTVILSTAAVALAGIGLAAWYVYTGVAGNAAFAQTVEQLGKARSISWTRTFYRRATGPDGSQTWIKVIASQCAYKAPGLYRETTFEENGEIRATSITDAVNKRGVTWRPREKKAILWEKAVEEHDPRGPFVWIDEVLKQEHPALKFAFLRLVETRKMATGEVNVFRFGLGDHTYDFWVDQNTKHLVEVYTPGANVRTVDRDIAFDVELDDALFRLDPPAGYAVEWQGRPAPVTEKEMIDYLGVLADYNSQTFPVQPFAPVSSEELNEIDEKPVNDRTAAEQKLRDTLDHYKRIGLNRLPVGHFVEESTVANSFRYLGDGVKLGDKDRIVCWYKPKGAPTYRVVYGDLSVKDVRAEDLPLPAEP